MEVPSSSWGKETGEGWGKRRDWFKIHEPIVVESWERGEGLWHLSWATAGGEDAHSLKVCQLFIQMKALPLR